MSYLDPPPFPAPVVVMKDVGGLVTDYQVRTEDYRATNRDVRLHECRSACTLALSLPNVCVYPDSVLKFHLAYDARNHASNYAVSQQMFDTYPAPVRARLGTLTRDYHVLSGAELIKLGLRDCTAPKEPKSHEQKIMVASLSKTVQQPIEPETSMTGMMHGLMSKVIPLTGMLTAPATTGSFSAQSQTLASHAPEKTLAETPLPPARPPTLNLAYTQPMPVLMRPRIMVNVMNGAAPILPSTTFLALATIPHWQDPALLK